jgi:hypothetical protein
MQCLHPWTSHGLYNVMYVARHSIYSARWDVGQCVPDSRARLVRTSVRYVGARHILLEEKKEKLVIPIEKTLLIWAK